MKHGFALSFATVLVTIFLLAPAGIAARAARECEAPELICKASANQDRSLYFRDHCRYQQKIHIERYKTNKAGSDQAEELRDTVVTVEPARQPDKTGRRA